jgi:hypothetical protein
MFISISFCEELEINLLAVIKSIDLHPPINVKKITTVATTALLVTTQSLLSLSGATAETLVRAHGRCKLTSGTYQAFDGYCVVKQKQQGNTAAIFVVELDNGSHYRFYGANKQALQVETQDGIHNVEFRENPDKGVFIWQDNGQTNRLSVKLDTQHNPDVSHDTPTNEALGTLIGVGVGALIGGLIAGSQSKPAHSHSSQVGNTPENLYSTVPPALADLVDARAGQAEATLVGRGYTYRNTQTWDGGKTSYYLENKTGYCVEVGTVDGRYRTIVYNSSDRCKASN